MKIIIIAVILIIIIIIMIMIIQMMIYGLPPMPPSSRGMVRVMRGRVVGDCVSIWDDAGLN